MARKIKKKSGTYWLDAKDREIHISLIKPIDRQRDAMVERIVKVALKMEAQLASLSTLLWDQVGKYLAARAKKAGADDVNWNGNIMLTNFDRTKQVTIEQSNLLDFDEQLTMACNLIQEYLEQEAENAPPALQLIIDEIFDVSKRGKINKQMILKLRQWNISHPKWEKAMAIINDSITVVESRRYCYIRVRQTAAGAWRNVSLNFSRQG